MAALAGVATTTASAVLGNRSYCYASEKTRERIFDAARELNFRPNPLARGLRGATTQKVGVIFDGVGVVSAATAKLRSIEGELWSKNYRLLVGMHRDDPAREAEYVRWCLSEAVDGIILSPTSQVKTETLRELVASRIPLVILETQAPIPTPYVGVDRELGGYLQVRHLLEIGRKKIAFLFSGTASQAGERKLAGIRRALAEAGMEADPDLTLAEARPMGDAAPSFGEAMARELLARNKPYDALVTTSDLVAMGAMSVLLEAGLRIPDDVALVGFDNDTFCPYLPVPLTTVHQPREMLGIKAVELLLDRIDGVRDTNADGTLPEILIKPRLIVRQSTVGSAATPVDADERRTS